MAPSNTIAEIIYRGIYHCDLTDPQTLTEDCFANYKTSISLSLIPGIILYSISGYLLGLIIDLMIENKNRPKNLVEEMLQ